MVIEEVEELVKSRKMVYRGKELLEIYNSDDYNSGLRLINIGKLNKKGEEEMAFCWIAPEDREKCDGNYTGNIKGILVSNPLSYYDVLFWGSEVQLKLMGNKRPILNPLWVENVILNGCWYEKENYN